MRTGAGSSGSSDAPAVVFDGLFDGFVFFGEAHEFEADGIDQGFPTGFDYVLTDAHGAPTAAMGAPLDQHADVGGGAFVGVEDADLVIGQAHVGDLRIELGEAVAQADVERVEGAVAGFGGGVDIVLRLERDGGGGNGTARGGAGVDFVAFDVEEVRAGAKRVADEEFEGAFGGF